jgi:hypothetical protein
VYENEGQTTAGADLLTPEQMADIKAAVKLWSRGGGHGVVVYSDTLPNGRAILRISAWIDAVHPSEALPS